LFSVTKHDAQNKRTLLQLVYHWASKAPLSYAAVAILLPLGITDLDVQYGYETLSHYISILMSL